MDDAAKAVITELIHCLEEADSRYRDAAEWADDEDRERVERQKLFMARLLHALKAGFEMPAYSPDILRHWVKTIPSSCLDV